MTFQLLDETTKHLIERSSIAATKDVVDKTVWWDPNLELPPQADEQNIMNQLQSLN